MLLVEEAGGTVTEFDGGTFQLRTPRELLASNGLIHEELKQQFARVFAGNVEELPSIPEYLKGR